MAPVREPFARRYSTCGNRVRRCDSRLCAIGGRKPDRRPYPHVLVYETLDGCQANVERGVREMPYRLRVKGLEIECDNVGELQAAVRALGGEAASNGSRWYEKPEASSHWTLDQYAKFLFLLRKPKQKKLFNFLLAQGGEGATTLDIQREVGIGNNSAIAGLMTSLMRNAGKVGVNGRGILFKNRVEIEGIRAIQYRLSDSLLEVARQYAKK